MNIKDMISIRERNNINARMKIVMHVFKIKYKDVVREYNKNIEDYNENFAESSLDKFKTMLRRETKVETLEPYIKIIVGMARDKCQQSDDKVYKRYYQILSYDTIAKIEEFYDFRKILNEQLAKKRNIKGNRKNEEERWLTKEELAYLRKMNDYELAELEEFEISHALFEFEKALNQLNLSTENKKFLVINWERIGNLAAIFRGYDFKFFMNCISELNVTDIENAINKRCELEPVKMLERAIQVNWINTMDYSSKDMKNIEEKLEKKIKTTTVAKLEEMLQIIEEIEKLTPQNMKIIFKIWCAGVSDISLEPKENLEVDC